MTSRVVRTKTDRQAAVALVSTMALPFSLALTKGAKRSVEQNRLQRRWLDEIAHELGDHTPEEVRGYCKLHFGVPILRDENPDFREKYDRILKPMDYETKLELMMHPIDFPVTRLMTTNQKTKYLDAVQKFAAERGVLLTQPENSGL